MNNGLSKRAFISISGLGDSSLRSEMGKSNIALFSPAFATSFGQASISIFTHFHIYTLKKPLIAQRLVEI
jgi:hypothetical protein